LNCEPLAFGAHSMEAFGSVLLVLVVDYETEILLQPGAWAISS
jgi:hypothetical protein